MGESPIDFFTKSEYPGNSPDLNPAGHLGSVFKDRVEDLMLKELRSNRSHREEMMNNMNIVLHEIENDVHLFHSLLEFVPRRIEAVKRANGSNTKY